MEIYKLLNKEVLNYNDFKDIRNYHIETSVEGIKFKTYNDFINTDINTTLEIWFSSLVKSHKQTNKQNIKETLARFSVISELVKFK